MAETLKFSLEFDTKFANITPQVKNLKDEVEKVFNTGSKQPIFKGLKKEMNSFYTQYNKMSHLKLSPNNIDRYSQEVEKLNDEYQKVLDTVNKLREAPDQKIANLQAQLRAKQEQLIKAGNYQYQANNEKDFLKTFQKAMGEKKSKSRSKEKRNELALLKKEITTIMNTIELETKKSKGVEELFQKIIGLKGAVQAAGNEQEYLNQQMSAFNSEKISRSVDSLITRFLSFRAVAFAIRRAFTSMKTTFMELDKSLVSIAAVSGRTRDQMWAQVGAYNEMAYRLGTTTEQVVKASKLYFQQGRTQSEAMELVEQTTILATVAELDFEEATNYLTAAVNGFNVEASESSIITDTWSALAAAAAVDVKELAIALSKVASLADSAGMSIQTTSAFLTKMIETTREAPENLGTALKTIISRFNDLKKSEEELGESGEANRVEAALASAGVALRDQMGNFRDFDTVLLELSKVWDTLSINTQKYIATQAAGSRQQSRFIALVSGYKRNLDLIDIAQDSVGSSTVQFQTQITGLEASFNRLKTAWEGFYTSFESGPSLLSAVVDKLSDFINSVADLGAGFTTLSSIIMVVATRAALLGFQFSMAKLAKEGLNKATVISIILGGKDLKSILAQIAANIKLAAVQALVAAKYIVLAGLVAGLVVGIGKLVNAEKDYIRGLKEEAEAAKAAAGAHAAKSKSAEGLAKEYEEAFRKGEDLSGVQKKVVDTFPELSDKLEHFNTDLEGTLQLFKDIAIESQKMAAGEQIKGLNADLKTKFHAEQVVYKASPEKAIAMAGFEERYKDLVWMDEGAEKAAAQKQLQEEILAQFPEFEKSLDIINGKYKDIVNTMDIIRQSGITNQLARSLNGQLFVSDEQAEDYSQELIEQYIPTEAEVSEAIALFNNQFEAKTKAEKAVISKLVRENFNKIFTATENSDGTVSWSINPQINGKDVDTFFNEEIKKVNERGQQLENEIKSKSKKALEMSEEEISNYASELAAKMVSGDTNISGEEFSMLEAIFGDFANEDWTAFEEQYAEEIDRLNNVIAENLTDFNENEISEKYKKLGVVGKRAFAEGLAAREEGAERNLYAQQVKILSQSDLVGKDDKGRDFIISTDAMVASLDSAENAFKILQNILNHVDTKKATKQIKVLTEAIDISQVDIIGMSDSLIKEMYSSWDKLKKASKDGLDLSEYRDLQNEFGDLISDSDFYWDELTGKMYGNEEAMIKVAKAIQEKTAAEAEANYQTALATMVAQDSAIATQVAATSTLEEAKALLIDKEASLANLIVSQQAEVLRWKNIETLELETNTLSEHTKQQLEDAQATLTKLIADKEDVTVLLDNIKAMENTMDVAKSGTAAQNYFTDAKKKGTKETDKATEALEREKKALEKSKRPYEDQKKALEKQIKLLEKSKRPLEKQIKLLEKQKEVIEDQVKVIEKSKRPYEDQIKLIEKEKRILEDQIKVIEKQKDAIQDKIDAIEKEKEAIQEKIDLLEKEKAVLEESRAAIEKNTNILLDAIKDRLNKELEGYQAAVNNYYSALEAALDELAQKAKESLDDLKKQADTAKDLADKDGDALQKQADQVIKFYDGEINNIKAKIDALKNEKDALDDLMKLEKARDDYEKARQKTRLVLVEGAGWRFKTDKDALSQASNNLASAEQERQVKLLEQQIDALEDIKKEWEKIAENIGKATSQLEKEAQYQAYLKGASSEELKNLQSQFGNSVGQNNILNENAIQAQNKYEQENDASSEGSLAWQIAQWEQAKKQAVEDKKQFDILTDENVKAVEDLKKKLLESLGLNESQGIKKALADGLRISTDSAQNVVKIKETLTALDELQKQMGLTTEEIKTLEEIQNGVNQAQLESLLIGGSTYNQLQNQIDNLINLNDKIFIIDGKIKLLNDQIAGLDDKIKILNKQIEQLDLKINLLNDQIEILDGKIDQINRYLESLDEQIEILNRKTEAIDEDIEAVEDDLELIDDKIEGINEQIEPIDDKLESIDDEIAIIDRKMEDIKDAVDQAGKNVSDAVSRIPVSNSTTTNIYQAAPEEKPKHKGGGGANSAFFPSRTQQLYSKGGLIDYTGPARVHGTAARPEMVLNNSQSAGLFRFLDKLSFSPLMNGLRDPSTLGTTNNTSSTDNSTAFNSCTFEINSDADSVDNLVKDMKRKAPFRKKS